MKHNIIKTENYLLVVDESEIKAGEWYLNQTSNVIEKLTDRLPSSGQWCKKIISHLPLNNSPILEGVDLLPKLYEQRTEITLEPEHIELLNQGNVEYFNDRIEYTLPQKFIKKGNKWFIEKTISKEK